MVTFDEITIAVGVIVALLTFIYLTYNATEALRTWKNRANAPVVDHEERIHDLEEWRKDVNKKLEGDWEFRQQTEDFEKLTLKCLRVILEGVDISPEVKEVKSELDKYLIEGRH